MGLNCWDDLDSEDQGYVRSLFEVGRKQDDSYSKMGSKGPIYRELDAAKRALEKCGSDSKRLLLYQDDSDAVILNEAPDAVQSLIDRIRFAQRLLVQSAGRPPERRYHIAVRGLSQIWEENCGPSPVGQFYYTSNKSNESMSPNARSKFIAACLRELDPENLPTDKVAFDKVRSALGALQKSG